MISVENIFPIFIRFVEYEFPRNKNIVEIVRKGSFFLEINKI